MLLTACAESYRGPLADKPIHLNGPAGPGTQVVTLFNHLLGQGLPPKALEQSFAFFDANRAIIRNKDWLSIADFTVHSGQPRLYVINLEDGMVNSLFLAHGIGSDPSHTGYARTFSNEPDSLMTSLGFFLVNESYYGKWGLSARLDGLQDSNSNARRRLIVLHGASYVDRNLPLMGRTEGCFGVELSVIEDLVSRVQGRSLLYSYIEGL